MLDPVLNWLNTISDRQYAVLVVLVAVLSVMVADTFLAPALGHESAPLDALGYGIVLGIVFGGSFYYVNR